MRSPSSRTAAVRVVRLLGRAVRGLFAASLLAALAAGVPCALVYGIGWPLPDHLPSLDEVGAVLMAPMSSSVLLDALACGGWLLWLVFVFDVAACAADVARGVRRPQLRGRTGPVQRVAAVLVGTLLAAVLGRTATAAPLAPAATARTASPVPAATVPASAADEHSQASSFATERVRSPHNGVHDSLWRIAQRCLGEGDRWPEIWALNKGGAQPGGRTLTDPNRIRPGDTLRLPATSPPPAPAPAEHRSPAPKATTPPHADPVQPATPPTGHRGASEPVGGAVTWGGGEMFVGFGLAAAVSGLLVLARRRRQARYRPGSGSHDDPPLAPAVYQLRLAHLRAQHHDEDTGLAAGTDSADSVGSQDRRREPAPERDPRSRGDEGEMRMYTTGLRRVIGAAASTGPTTPPSVFDTTDSNTNGDTPAAAEGTRIALDLARVHGLGLVGPGAYAATRALVLSVLTTTPEQGPAPIVLVPAADLGRLLGVPASGQALPDTVTVVADLNDALDVLDPRKAAPYRPVVLIAAPPRDPDQQARLQHLLDNHAQHGLAALLLGQWRAGITAYVTAAGTISATDPGAGEPLRGTRAFTLPDTVTRALLDLLRTAHPRDDRPADRLRKEAKSSRSSDPPSDSEDSPGRLEITAGTTAPELSLAEEEKTRIALRPPKADSGPPASAPPLALTVFGTPTLRWRPDPARPDDEPRDLSGELSNRPLELLAFLAVHPGGTTRDAIVDALWPGHPPRNPASVLRTVLSRIRRTLDSATHGAVGDLVLVEHGQYRLDPARVEVDFWSFADAVTARRAAATAEHRTDACEAIVAHYGGALADGLDSEWLAAAREATRRDALDAVAALARARVADDPDYTLDLLETARAFDPHNELVYRDIMRLQHRLGRHDAISRTLTLLRTRLAELDMTPTTDTVALAQRLREHDTGIPVDDTARPSAS